jgi:hypothetical protein
LWCEFQRMTARTTSILTLKGGLRLAAAVALALVVASAFVRSTVDAQASKATAIQSISVSANGPALVVVIEGNGALPTPTPGVADGPPRIFLDFPGVGLRASKVTASTDPRLQRVRAAVNSVSPMITRVVLDLAAAQPFVLENGSNRVSIVVGAAAGVVPTAGARRAPTAPAAKPTPPPTSASPSTPAPSPVTPTSTARTVPPPMPVPMTSPAPPPAGPPPAPVAEPFPAIPPVPNLPGPANAAPPRATAAARPPESAPAATTPAPAPKVTVPPVPPARSSSPSSLPVPPPKDLDRYRRQVSPALDRLRLQEPLLMSLDSAESQPMDRVQLAVEEFERLRGELAGIKPPDSLRSQHDMLIQSTTLALMATRLRVEAFRTSDPATLRNVASAAAGATLLLDRACADLGCPDSGR